VRLHHDPVLLLAGSYDGQKGIMAAKEVKVKKTVKKTKVEGEVKVASSKLKTVNSELKNGHNKEHNKEKTQVVDQRVDEVASKIEDRGSEIEAATGQSIEYEVESIEVSSALTPNSKLQTPNSDDKPLAKAGKRSAKAIAEVEAVVAKEERKAKQADDESDEDARPTQHKNATRTKLERSGKKLREAAKLIEVGKEYTLTEALDLVVKTSTTKFDSSVEVHVNLGVDPRQADQNIRDNLMLPAGTGKTVRVAVFADADLHAAAKKAGADIVGADDFLQLLDKELINFDILVATPQTMPKLGKYARLLGPKGLMPNPKSGTVTIDVEKAVAQAKAGRVEYRVDSTGIVHLAVGKVSFGPEKLRENVGAVFASIKNAKPGSIKGNYVKSIHLTTSMGPSIKLATSEL
jgi:ribosomal protein L1